ncbi:MAG TPA: FkbM family methyltransferase, partial [Candidatus Binatus sp.]|nr:FkbM family methyltransferase [Candidatus Binatus sp.]
CGGLDHQIGLISLLYYFTGTITGLFEDERPIVRLLNRLIDEGDVFFDLGANLGFYSFYVGPLCGRSGSVHAFEPNPRLIPLLYRSIELNRAQSNIHLNAVAVGGQSGMHLPLYDPDDIVCSSLFAHGWLNRDSTVLVPVITIDDYIREREIKRIDVMKIDIEGAELEAFQGMEETFRVCPPGVIICEVLPFENTYGRDHIAVLDRPLRVSTPSLIAEFLRAKGYEMFQIVKTDGRLISPEMSVSTSEVARLDVNVAYVLTDIKDQLPEIFVTD